MATQKPLDPEVLMGDPKNQIDKETLAKASEVLANILDSAIQVPGTNIRIGLDPLIGLIPGIGDALASFVGSTIIVMASRLQVPKIILFRMSANLMINGAIGAIPVLGDFFSVWFKSNARNAQLLRRHSSSAGQSSTAGDWIFVIGMIAATLAVTLAAIAGVVWLVSSVWQWAQ